MDALATIGVGRPIQPRAMSEGAAKQSAKQAAWQRIQAEAPDHADLLRAITAAFGKPAMVSITINGERLL